jgi:hypothetical protein
MNATELVLTDDERALLVDMLKAALTDTRVEVHHTHGSPQYRDQVKRREDVIRDLLAKLG